MVVHFIPYRGVQGPTPVKDAQIGNGTRTLRRMPYYGLYDYSQSSMIYLADELTTAGLGAGSRIYTISFQFTGWSTGYTVNNQTIKISHVQESIMPERGDPQHSELTLSDTTVVKDKFQHVIPSNENWEAFLFDVEFVWDGTSNILISWENRDGTWVSGYGSAVGTAPAKEGARGHNWFSDRRYPDAPSGWDNGVPNLKLSTR